MGHKILLVDDDPGMIHLMGRILSSVGQLRFATSGAAALRQVRELAPDLVLLDSEMPGMSGYEVCQVMKSDPELANIPVIFVTAHSGLDYELRGLNVGAADFIAKPISEPLLVARVKTQLRIKQLTDELRRIATIDALTEVHNRRAFDDMLNREWQRSLRTAEPISLLMIDIDHFKLFNDNYGHPAGDACLRSVAQALGEATKRPADSVSRYGGEEFAVLLPQTNRIGAEHVARRALEAVIARNLTHEKSPTASMVTISIGISSFDDQCPGWSQRPNGTGIDAGEPRTAQDLVDSADRALYEAKREGRAQIRQFDIDADDSAHAALLVETWEQPSGRRAPS